MRPEEKDFILWFFRFVMIKLALALFIRQSAKKFWKK